MTGTGTADRDVTTTEAAAIVGRSDLTIRRWINRGLLPARKVGSRVVIRESDVRRMLAGEPVEAGTKN